MLDVIRIAAVNQLSRLAVAVSVAGTAVRMIDERVLEKPRKGLRWVLVLTPASDQTDEPVPKVGTAMVLRVSGSAMLEHEVRLRLSDPLAYVTVDLSRLAIKTAEALASDQAVAA